MAYDKVYRLIGMVIVTLAVIAYAMAVHYGVI